ncbi:MAG: NAD(P)-dependent oxidoreductase [Alphaproteobacteria bacterium]
MAKGANIEMDANMGDISVIGAGQMGAALAQSLLNAGFRVCVWNRTAAKLTALADAGARVAGTPAEAVSGARWVIVCLTDQAVTDAVLKAASVARALKGNTVVQFSTISPRQSRDFGAWAAARGISYLDGTILGYPSDVIGGRCTVVYSGPKVLYDNGARAFAAMGGNPKHAGETIGAAPAFARAINSYSFAGWLAFFHGAAICHKSGFPIDMFVETATSMLPSREAAMHAFGKKIAARDYGQSQAALALYAAAYDHVVDISAELEIDTAFPKMVAGYFERAIAAGNGDRALPALFESLIEKTD